MDVLGKIKNSFNVLGKKIQNIGSIGRKIFQPKINAYVMPDSDKIYAAASIEMYKSPSSRLDIEDYKYTKGDAESGAWVSPTKIIIAFRGSVTAKDWLISDVKIALGTEVTDSRVQKSIRFADEISKQYPGRKITLTGHSLAGRAATIVSQKTGLRVVSFSTGCGKSCITDYEKCQSSNRPSWCGLKKSHRVKGDPLSSADLYGDVKIYDKKGSAPHAHSMKNFV